MAKISTYAIDSTPSLSDKVIGTDVGDSNITKNYTLGDIHGLITSNLTNLSIPIWDDANTEFVDSAFAQDKFSSPKYITFSTLLYQQNLGGSTYLGDNAGAEDNFDGEGSGNFNVGIGFETLGKFTTGANPVSGAASAGENVALGYRALKSTTKGTNNIAIGADSLNANTLGYNNVAISKNALGSVVNSQQSLATNEFSIGIGFAAGNPSSNQVNTLSGHSGSTMVGHQAMADIVYDTDAPKPSNNVAIGLRTFRQTGTATLPSYLFDNTAIGAFAGFRARLDTNGGAATPENFILNENIFIGKNAGYDIKAAALGTAPSGMTLGKISNNTFIGGTSIPKYVASGNVIIETGGIGNTLGAQSDITENNAAATNLLITGNTQVIGSSNIILNPIVAEGSESGIKNTIGQQGTGNENNFSAHNIILSNRYPGEYGGADSNKLGQNNKITITNGGVLDKAKLRNNLLIGTTGATLNADTTNNSDGVRDNTIINGEDIDILTTDSGLGHANTIVNSKFLQLSGSRSNFIVNTRGASATAKFNLLTETSIGQNSSGNVLFNASNYLGTVRSDVRGSSNFVMNSDTAIMVGNFNTVLGAKGTIAGNNNLMHGSSGQKITGNNHFIFGQNNEILDTDAGTSTRVGVIGFDNVVTTGTNGVNSNNAFVGGAGNAVSAGINSFVFGQGLVSTKRNSTIVGKFNKDDGETGTTSLFEVGCGVNTTNRNNALAVKGSSADTVIYMDQLVAQNYINDTAAGAAGILLGGLYHTDGVVKINTTA